MTLCCEKFNSSSCKSVAFTHHKLSDKFYLQQYLCTWLSVVPGENKDAGASSRDGQHTSSQQLQQGDTVESFRQTYLSSGKFNFNVIHFLDACLRVARLVTANTNDGQQRHRYPWDTSDMSSEALTLHVYCSFKH